MQELVRLLTLYLAAGVEVGAAVVVGFAAVEAMAQAATGLLKGEFADVPKEEIRLRLARWLTLAIEFELGADIIRTMIAPTWNDIGQLAAIIVIRTTLNFFLGQETGEPGEDPRPVLPHFREGCDEAQDRRNGLGIGRAIGAQPGGCFCVGQDNSAGGQLSCDRRLSWPAAEAAPGAKSVGGFVLGISPGLSEDEHVSKWYRQEFRVSGAREDEAKYQRHEADAERYKHAIKFGAISAQHCAQLAQDYKQAAQDAAVLAAQHHKVADEMSGGGASAAPSGETAPTK